MADRKRILVADDDSDIINLLEITLAPQGYEILKAGNGQDALDIALTQKPDLILLDVMMPKMDGYHVAYEVTSRLGSAAPQILMITSRDMIREKGIVLMSGALEGIQKPFDLKELSRKIKELLSQQPRKPDTQGP